MAKNTELLAKTGAILDRYEICDSCLGRLFGKLSHGLANEDRGKSLRISSAIARDEPPVEPAACEICHGLCSELDGWAERAIEEVQRVEFGTFLFGTRLTEEMLDNQETVEKEFELDASEDFSHAINRKLGKKFRDGLYEKSRNVEADFESPDLTVLVDFRSRDVDLDIRPTYYYGRYRKLSRGVPQTIWHCRHCWGSGCEACSYTGRKYDDSVEERVSKPLKRAARGGSTVFHGAGREDLDVLTDGEGRPFVVEVKNPKIRDLDYEKITEDINAGSSGVVEITKLKKVNKSAVRTLKQADLDKIYRVEIELDEPVAEELILETLTNIEGRIYQRTPGRVSHRRAKKVRVRGLKSTSTSRLSDRVYRVDLRTEGGLYIKELFTGERTVPSLPELLGTSIKVRQLDVLDIPGRLEEKESDAPENLEYEFIQTGEDFETNFIESN